MDLTVVTKNGPEGREVERSALVDKHLELKLDKIETRMGRAISARAVLTALPVGYEVSVTLHGKRELVGRARHDELLAAVDGALDKLIRQVETLREKRSGKEQGRRHSGTHKQQLLGG